MTCSVRVLSPALGCAALGCLDRACAILVRLSKRHLPCSFGPATGASGVGHQHCLQAGIACSDAGAQLCGYWVERLCISYGCRQDLPAAKRAPAGFWTRVMSPAEQLWPRLQDVVNLRYKEVVEPLIQQSKPRWVFETSVLSFEIGDVPPAITGVKAFKESSSPNHASSLLRR